MSDHASDFVYEQNVLRFSSRLETEEDPALRKRLSKLLLEEENKFAATAERVDKIDRHISASQVRVTRQYGLLDRLKIDGHDTRLAEKLLQNLEELYDLSVDYREVLVAALARSGL
jgi:hypothetical protein